MSKNNKHIKRKVCENNNGIKRKIQDIQTIVAKDSL